MNPTGERSPYSRVDLKRGHDRRVLRGHPWIFSNELAPSDRDFEPGQLVRVFSSKGRYLGTGYINPHSLIAVRLLRRTDGPVDDEFLAARLDSAFRLRRRLYPGEEAIRLVYSESDGLPGLIVDRYGDHLAVQVTTAGMEKLFPAVLEIVCRELDPVCVVARNDVPVRRLEGLPQSVDVLMGEPDPDLAVRYEGLTISVDLMGGQKTGLYLDQRDNQRTLLPDLAVGDVLDCYCYQGLWSLLALKHGAGRVTGVDASAEALRMASDHAVANGMDSAVEWIRGDAIELLKEYRSERRRFDMVILDPPAFVKSRKHLKAGLRGYLDLNRKGMEVLAPGGVLITCSCSHHVKPEQFTDTVSHAVSLTGRHARVLATLGQSRDHPPLATAPETAYLKCLALLLD